MHPLNAPAIQPATHRRQVQCPVWPVRLRGSTWVVVAILPALHLPPSWVEHHLTDHAKGRGVAFQLHPSIRNLGIHHAHITCVQDVCSLIYWPLVHWTRPVATLNLEAPSMWMVGSGLVV
ncbi:hypothetical protein NP493_6g06042 [Ridgeia piscesae]|uniref:Uncharacterized protein n=1 Tax=Ridgeia piscesae TaxID=27915 RepID=A0AAD9PFK5_RIDPI|nr:hypothetical protein NP493_6g06042 [Ridgeia piscesae]